MGTGFGLKLYNKHIREQNPGSAVQFLQIPRIKDIKIGKGSFGPISIYDADCKNGSLRIGNYCSIARGSLFMFNEQHDVSKFSTFPFKKWGGGTIQCTQPLLKEKDSIVLDDDVWIGLDALVMSDSHIGQGAVVAARAVVKGNIEPYSIVGGIPAKTIKMRFSDSIVSELMECDFSKITQEMINEHFNELNQPLNSVSQIEWIPRKVRQ